jgi:endonuclease/exonuclease/phosphatase (EEP) superfamily protein YafD
VAADVVFLLESSFEWEDAIAREGIPMATVAVVPEGRLAGITILADPELRPRLLPTGLGPIDQAAAVELTVDGTKVVVLGLHPPSPVSRSRAEARDGLLENAGRWIADRSERSIVVGDLNATPWSAAYRELRWRGRLHDTLVGSGLQPTWPAGWGPLMVPIDHALHTDGLVTIERRTGPSLGSAHRSLVVTVAVAT